MKKITQKSLKKELVKIINDSKIKEVIYEPRYNIDPRITSPIEERVLVGSIITIRTTYKK
jgi:hypothetical protein